MTAQQAQRIETQPPCFVLPPDGEVFTNDILERTENLIDAGIWEGIETTQLRGWMKNFHTSEERYFAASVLDALIYRSRAQTIAMMDQLFDRSLADLTRLNPPSHPIPKDWKLALQGRRDPGIRIVPVIRDSDPPTKSGPLIARYYRRHLDLNDRWMIWPWQLKDNISSGVKAVLFIDDFLGTGTQFLNFTTVFEIRTLLTGIYAVYAPLVAHQLGLGEVQKALPALTICPVERLDSRYSLFAKDSLYFQDGTNTSASAAAFYDDLLDRRLPEVKARYRDGWGTLQLAYAFNHAIPNNCLPILWFKTDNWHPLFER